MALTLALSYAAIAVVTAVAFFVVSARLGEERRPTAERIGLSAAAGIVWPMILLGVAELSSFAMYAKVHEHDDETERVLVVV